MTSPFEAMQRAVDIVNSSPHPVNKIAATLFKDDFRVSCTNDYPKPIEDKIGTDKKIGISSGSVHTEFLCTVSAFPQKTEGASICITDPFCPNCGKGFSEAGITDVYVDHKGFGKDFWARRKADFEMSLLICKEAGINVYEIYRKEKRKKPFFEIAADYQPRNENPVIVESMPDANDEILIGIVQAMQDQYAGQRFAVALAQDDKGNIHALSATTRLTIRDAKYRPGGKYSPLMEPGNRVLMSAARHGLRIVKFYSAQVPTSREQVNFVGAGLESMLIGDLSKARDQGGLDAMLLLEQHGIVNYEDASKYPATGVAGLRSPL